MKAGGGPVCLAHGQNLGRKIMEGKTAPRQGEPMSFTPIASRVGPDEIKRGMGSNT